MSESFNIGILRIMKHLPPDNSVETVSVRITGRVQGIGFRAACIRQAHKMGVTGWVRNAADQSVEAMLQGPHDQVDRMLSWLLTGPPGARVDEVSSEALVTDRLFDRFEQW
ncbi:acylphosphatase [Paralcaligenes ureilyticus]